MPVAHDLPFKQLCCVIHSATDFKCRSADRSQRIRVMALNADDVPVTGADAQPLASTQASLGREAAAALPRPPPSPLRARTGALSTA